MWLRSTPSGPATAPGRHWRVVHDDAEAVRWYRLAADQGDADAQQNLGRHYVYGTGVARDNAEALRWYHLTISIPRIYYAAP
jgi:TPR repeat protein